MDRFEKSLDVEPAPPPAPERFAPWWGWFGLIAILAGLAAWAVRAVN
jgi:ubiquinone biosynthesis protein